MHTDWNFGNAASNFYKGIPTTDSRSPKQQQQHHQSHDSPHRALSIPGVEYTSPSENSTNDPANWPPFISADQHGWLPVQAGGSPPNPNMQLPAAGYPLLPNNFPGASYFQQGLPHHHGLGGTPSSSVGDDSAMLEINWSEWDKIFPPDQNTGHLDITPPKYAPRT